MFGNGVRIGTVFIRVSLRRTQQVQLREQIEYIVVVAGAMKKVVAVYPAVSPISKTLATMTSDFV